MAFYETVFIVRQDVSSADVDKLTEEFSNILDKNAAKVLKTEYWGLRNLAYEINNNKKGHYVMLGSESPPAAIAELERKMKYNEDVIRFLTIRVNDISSEPSAILQNKNTDFDQTVDVTVNQ